MTPPTRPDATAQARQLAEQCDEMHQWITDALNGDTRGLPSAENRARRIAEELRALTAATAAQEAEVARLKALLAVECTCRVIEKCERCEAIDGASHDESR